MTLGPTFLHRTVWRLSRTPLSPLIKTIKRAGVRDDIRRRRQLAQTFAVSADETRLAAEIDRNGYCVISEVVDAGVLQALSEAAGAKYERGKNRVLAQESVHKDYWTRLLDEDRAGGTLPTDNPFVAFALQPAVLSILAKTYGELPFLDDVLLLLSRDTGKHLSLSQLWHRDYDDLRTIKVYVYLTDVHEAADGPFTFLPGPVSDRFGFSLRSRHADEAIEAKLRPGEMKVMVAPRLSVSRATWAPACRRRCACSTSAAVTASCCTAWSRRNVNCMAATGATPRPREYPWTTRRSTSIEAASNATPTRASTSYSVRT